MNARTLDRIGEDVEALTASAPSTPSLAARRGIGWPAWLTRVIGVVFVLAVWELVAETVLSGRHVLPAPTTVVAKAFEDDLYGSSLGATMWEAFRGWVIGTALAAVFAAISILVPRFEAAIARLGVISYCIPTVAIGPILIVLFSDDTTKVTMAALSVFFVTLMGMTVGLRAAPKSVLDYIQSCGGHSGQALVKVRLRAAIPASIAGIALGAPAAILGAIVGDFMGGTKGLGIVMMQAQSSFQVSRVWAVGLVSTAVSGLLFAAIAGIGRIFGADALSSADAPDWESRSSSSGADPRTRSRWLNALASAAEKIAKIVFTVIAVLGAWWALLAIFTLNPYFARTPLDVWRSLGRVAGIATRWSQLSDGLIATLEHATLGFLLGTIAAIVVAAISLSAVVDAAVLPIVVMLRSVPLVSMTPLLGLLLGDGDAVIVVTGAIVTFVPSVVTIASGIRATPAPSLDLFYAYGSSRMDSVVKLRIRYALPALCSAVKVAVPGAILGSVLAEWLLGSSGVGHLMAVSIIGSDFNLLWASATAITIVSLVLYQLINDAEDLVIRWAVQ
ncbi:MAG TPA: ABC transporter permease subunit [Jatrophihabitans sp.]